MIEAFGVEAAVILRGLTAAEVGMVLAPALLGNPGLPRGGNRAPPCPPRNPPGSGGSGRPPGGPRTGVNPGSKEGDTPFGSSFGGPSALVRSPGGNRTIRGARRPPGPGVTSGPE